MPFIRKPNHIRSLIPGQVLADGKFLTDAEPESFSGSLTTSKKLPYKPGHSLSTIESESSPRCPPYLQRVPITI